MNKLYSVETMRHIRLFVAVYGPPFVIFVVPALINGFPLVYSDSGTYLRAAIVGTIPDDRPIYYSLFLFPLHWRATLWPPIAVQSAMAIAVLDIFLRRNLAPLPRLHLGLLLCSLAVLTSLPVFASQIMPDLFTPLMILSLSILIFRWSDITSGERPFLYTVSLAGLCFHQANFLIAFLTIIFAIPFRLALDRSWSQSIRVFAVLGSLVALGVGLLLLPNYIAYHEFVATRGSGTFLLAKLIDNGPGLDYLTAKCRVQDYSICSQLPAIRHHKEIVSLNPTEESTEDYFLWDGPRRAAGDWDGLALYAGSMAVASILQEPRAFALASFAGFAHQLFRFDTGDGLRVYGPETWISKVLKTYFLSGVNRAYLASRQETGRLGLTMVIYLHRLSVIAALLVIGILLVGTFRTDRALGGTACTLLLAVLANAAVTGALSVVVDRYQSRVVGLIVIAAIILAYARKFQTKNQFSLSGSSSGG